MSEVGMQADVVAVCVFTDDQLWQVRLDGALLPSAMPAPPTSTWSTPLSAVRPPREQPGVPESTVLTALAQGSAAGRALDIVAARGSVAPFIEVAGQLFGKDVAGVRSIAGELDSDLGALADVIKVVDAAGKV